MNTDQKRHRPSRSASLFRTSSNSCAVSTPSSLQFVQFLKRLDRSVVQEVGPVSFFQLSKSASNGDPLDFSQLGQLGDYFRCAHDHTITGNQRCRNDHQQEL